MYGWTDFTRLPATLGQG